MGIATPLSAEPLSSTPLSSTPLSSTPLTADPSVEGPLHPLTTWELPICQLCHVRSSPFVRGFFSWVSRIGDGHYGYVVLAGLFVVLGAAAVPVALQAVAVALVAHVAYRTLKRRTARPRPLDVAAGFDFTVPPLDRYSFPSGHTLHAVSSAFVIAAHAPVFAWVLVPFAVLVAASRVVLGLHYPTDVLAGALLGSLIAWASFLVPAFSVTTPLP